MKKIATTSFIAVALCAACGGRTMGATNDNVNTNDNNTNQPPRNLTRRILVTNVKNQVMGFALDMGDDCPVANLYPDVGAEGLDEFLCWAIHYADMLRPGKLDGLPDGTFSPEKEVPQAEAWKITSELIGFLPYGDAECARIEVEAWYTPWLGTLCEKGLIPDLPYPAAKIPLTVWADYMFNLRSYMEQTASRVAFGELLLSNEPDDVLDLNAAECDSTFSDVESGSFECMVAENMVTQGLMVGGQTNFRPEEPLVWAYIFKLTALYFNIEGPAPEGCTDIVDPEHWGYGWTNLICSYGVLPEEVYDVAEIPTIGQAANFLYNVAIEMNQE